MCVCVCVCASATVLLTRLKPPSRRTRVSRRQSRRHDSTCLEIAAVSPAFRFARRLQVESFAAAFGIWQLQTEFSS